MRGHAFLEPQDLCRAAWKDIVEFSQTESFSDDFTCVAVKIEMPEPEERYNQEWKLEVPSDLGELGRVRSLIRDMCKGLGSNLVDDEKIKMIQIVATEIMTNIIKHAYQGKPGETIAIEGKTSRDEIILYFYDWGIEFDFASAPKPVFDGSREDGFGLHIIAHTADYVRYSRDSSGKNCACVTFFLQRRE